MAKSIGWSLLVKQMQHFDDLVAAAYVIEHLVHPQFGAQMRQLLRGTKLPHLHKLQSNQRYERASQNLCHL